MRLRHQPLEVIHEPFAAVLGVLVMTPDVNRLLRADFLAIAAEDAAEFVDLEDQWIAIALLVFTRHQLDAVRRTDRWTQSAAHAFRLAVLGGEHAMRAAPARRERPFLLGI